MKKLILSSLVTASLLSVTACCDKTKPQSTEPAKTTAADTTSKAAATTAGVAAASALALGDFDWSGINKSSVDLGGFPYFNLPEGMKLLLADGTAADGSTDGATPNGTASKTWENGAINIYDGKQIFNTDGKLNYLDIVMAADGGEFDKDKFDQHVTDYMNKIGAVEFFDDKVPTEAAEQLKTLDGMNHQDYMAGDFADRTLRQFAVNHDNGQLFYQVMSDGSHGEIGIIETEGFSAAADTQPVTVTPEPAPITVIEDPTADEMMNQLDSSGKAILNIHFDTAKSSIRADDQSIIEQIYALMSEHPEINLSVEGHTDDQGEAEMNQSLSQSRAEQVKAVLVDKGIDAARLKAVGHGESKPIAANDTAENKAKNRRVELVRF